MILNIFKGWFLGFDMRIKKTLASIVLVGATILGLGNRAKATPILYDDFSSPTLNASKWDVRQDTEGQPHMDEHYVDTDNQNFHLQQNTIGDRRTYLVPKRTFTTGDKLEYDVEVVSREGNYGNFIIVTGDQNIRTMGEGYVNGVQGYDELGLGHIELEFFENNLRITREAPSGSVPIENVPLNNSNGIYELYIGGLSGHNGKCHIDLDNFYTDVVPEPITLGLLGFGGLALLRKRE